MTLSVLFTAKIILILFRPDFFYYRFHGGNCQDAMSGVGMKIQFKFRYILKMHLKNADCFERQNPLEVMVQTNVRAVSVNDLSIW